ncbi:MAG: hypothetical protein LC105_07330 [Chitinophagales bacterium]|nr:hypothetical protein [Chitinophagales bacterium]
MIKKIILSLGSNKTSLLLIFLLIVSTIIWGKYWGWVDDIFLNAKYSGLFYKEPLSDIDGCFIISSNIIVLLYKYFPDYNWYSLFLNSTLFISFILIVKTIEIKMSETRFSHLFLLLFIIFFYFSFLAEFYLYITFTQVCVIGATSAGVYILTHSSKSSLLIILFLVIASLIRYEAVMLTLPFYLPFLFFKRFRRKLRQLAIVHSILLFVFCCTLLKMQLNNSEWKLNTIMIESANYSYVNSYKNIDTNSTLYAKVFSIMTMFTGDLKTQMTPDVKKIIRVNRLELLYPEKIIEKLKHEYIKSSKLYSKDYMPSRNWINKAKICLVFLIIISIPFIRRKQGIVLINILVFVLTIFFITINYKIEYRIFYVLFFSLLLLIMTIAEGKSLHIFFSILFILSIIYTPYKWKEFTDNKKYLEKEKYQKQMFMKELDTQFNKKLVFFDLGSIGVFYPGWIKMNVKKNTTNTYLIYGENSSNFHQPHLDYLKNFCESTDILSFFKCLYQREDVIFAFSETRISMYEMYFQKVYGWNLKFKTIDNKPNKLSNIKYSYNPYPLHLNYYDFKKD